MLENTPASSEAEQRTGPADPRVAAFCSSDRLNVFHPVAYHSQIGRPDPFDVETIHEEARATFQRLVHRASAPSGIASGRILLLLGEAGSGKTHLMRAFRQWAHARARGYSGYLPMTSATSHYGRYVLNHLIDSLDQPYDERTAASSALRRLSTGLAESPRGVALDRLEQIRGGELDSGCLAKMIDALADQIVMDDRFNNVDFDLIRALLYLQCNDPRLNARVLKYLRCEDLSERDRRLLGDIQPRGYDNAPERLIHRLGGLMAALESVPLILCVDQLEDIYNLDDSTARFRRAMACLCDLASRLPTAVVVISCLENFYDTLKRDLAKSIVDRIEKDPAPVLLKGTRDEEEVVRIVSQRLRYLYETLDVPFRAEEPVFPFPPAYLKKLAGLPTREVLSRCQEYQERCIAAGALVPIEAGGAPAPLPITTDTSSLEQAWNDFRADARQEVPDDEAGRAELLSKAIRACADEVGTGHWFEAEAEGRLIEVERHGPDNAVDRLLVGLCEAAPQGGALGRQIAEVVKRAGEHTPVIVRSTEFPSNPKTAIAKQVGEFITGGGRRAVVEDSEWRAVAAYTPFRARHQLDPGFGAWLKQEQPLGRLRALRAILDLDHLKAPRIGQRTVPRKVEPLAPHVSVPSSGVTTKTEPTTQDSVPVEAGPLLVGLSADRAQGPVTIEPGELTRHAAFLGGTGSGKTTVALNIVEQLLLRGIPAILVDRKGDLCGYARAESWTRPLTDPELTSRRERLRTQVDVAVYTPGNPQGRPLSISIAPAGLGQFPSFERGQVARYAASALAGMMNYGGKGNELARQAILAQAIDLLAQLERDGSVTLEGLIDYIAEEDAGLVNAIGRLDTKLFGKLVNDLETLRLSRGEFLSARGEPLNAEALLGLDRHAAPGKTRLSIISTKFLGATQDVQFWISLLSDRDGPLGEPVPIPRLQAVMLFDEADLYLPAQQQPPSKEPMEDLLRRARAAGLGLLLATQSPGDFDYKCRDNIRAWFVGRVKEPTALAKMKPMLSECRVDVASRLPVQEAGEFHLIRDGAVVGLHAGRSAIATEQLPEDEILALARGSRRN